MIKLCAFADEAAVSLDGQIEALKKNNIDLIELRGIDGVNVSKISLEDAEGYAKRLSEAGIRVWSIGSPIGKIKLSDDVEAHMELLTHVCRLAKVFGTDKIRMFSFYEAYEDEERVFSLLRSMVEIADRDGVKLYHENEKKIYGDTAERVLKIMENVKGLYYVYDPANFIEVNEDSSHTLDALHSRTDYFHIKDVIAETHQLVPAGYGDGKIGELIERITDDKVLTIEPHLKIFKGFSEIDNSEMKNRFVFNTNAEAFDAAVAAIKQQLTDKGYRETEGGFVR